MSINHVSQHEQISAIDRLQNVINTLCEKSLLFLSLWLISCLFFLSQSFASTAYETLRWQTNNGATVVFYQTMEVPMLTVSVAFAAGSAYDDDNEGLSWLTTHLLNQGNHGLDASIVAEHLSDTGAQYDTAVTKDLVVLNLKTLVASHQLAQAIDVFSSIIAHPDFNQSAFIREKNQQLIAIDQLQESPDNVADQTFFQILYKNHPYGHPSIGTRMKVNQLTLEDIHQFYQRYFVSKNAIIVLVGAINKTKAQQIAEQITKDLPSGKPADAIPTATGLSEPMDIVINYPSTQTIIRLGQLGITHQDKRLFPLQVGNYILGGGTMTSELTTTLREKSGLTYSIYSQFSPMPGHGPFIIGLSTKNSQASNAIEMTRKVLMAFTKNGPTEQELLAAKQYLTGSFQLSLASNRNIAEVLLKMTFYHLPESYLRTYVDHINAISTNEIKKVFQEIIEPNKLLQVSVGKG